MKSLTVPFDEKDEAKTLGAKWDAAARQWFVPDGLDESLFARWFPADLVLASGGEGTMRARRFALLTGTVVCWKCRKETRVSTLLLRGYTEEDEDGIEQPERQDTVLSAILALDPATRKVFADAAPWMRPGHSKAREQIYLAAHCEHCEALQGAWFLSEPGSAFFPQSPQEAARLTVQWFHQPVIAEASPSWSSWTDWVEGP